MTTAETRKTLRFTRMCMYWGSNRCRMGDDCNFAHSDSELRQAPDLVATKLCYQFSNKGQCSKGAACTFAHGKKELREAPKEVTRPKQMEPIKVQVSEISPMKAMQSKLGRLALFPTNFRPPPGLTPPTSMGYMSELEELAECLSPLKDDFDLESSASTASPFSPRMDSESEPCSPCSPKSEIFWL